MKIKPKTRGMIQLIGLIAFFIWGIAAFIYGNYKAYQLIVEPTPVGQLDTLIKWQVQYKGDNAHFVPVMSDSTAEIGRGK